MDDLEKISGLFADLGPIASPDAVLAEAEAPAWTVLLPEVGEVSALLQPDSRCLAFTVDVGPLPVEAPEAVQTGLLLGLLQLGFYWRESGAISGALDGDGAVSLVYRHPVAALDVQRLAQIVARLGRLRSVVAEALAAATAAPGAAPDGVAV